MRLFVTKLGIIGWVIFITSASYKYIKLVLKMIDYADHINWVYVHIPYSKGISEYFSNNELLTTLGFMFLGLLWIYLARNKSKLPVAHVEIYSDINDLHDKHSTSILLKSGNEIDALWLTGEGVFTGDKDLLENRCIKRLILPNPESTLLQNIHSSLGMTKNLFDYKKDINNVSKIALNYGAEVRWYSEFTGVSLTIVKRKGKSKYIHLQPCIPHEDSSKRITIIFKGFFHKSKIRHYTEWFEKIWENSETPTPDDLL